MGITVHEIAYHRNGVGGMPFYVCRFTDPDAMVRRADSAVIEQSGEFIATVFAPDPITSGDMEGEPDWTYSEGWQNPRVAVLSLDLLPNITFGENSWRGDRYADELFAAIVESERAAV